MPYYHETCNAGKTRQHSFYYAPRADMKGGSRRKKENRTSEAQEKVNRRHAVKKLTWILNENFDGTCLYVTWTYAKENRPDSESVLKEDVGKLLRSIRQIYKKSGRKARYVWVTERGGKGAAHIHMVINGIETRQFKKCWTKGFITVKPLDDSGQYRKLAEYFIKYSEKTMRNGNGDNPRRKWYNSSKGLKIPLPRKKVVRCRNAYSHTIGIPAGWYLDKGSIAEAYHEVTGFMYFTYTLIRGGKRNQPQQQSTYVLDLDTGSIPITEKPLRRE